jgi:predicted RNA-binding protein with PIN domain
VKLNRFIATSLVLAAGVTAGTCLAQSSNDQQETITESGAAHISAVAVPSAVQPTTVAEKTREQVMRELVEFQNSLQAAQVREIYRGS